MKNEQLRNMRSSLNSAQADYGNILLEREELIKRTHRKEEVDAKVNLVTGFPLAVVLNKIENNLYRIGYRY